MSVDALVALVRCLGSVPMWYTCCHSDEGGEEGG